MTEVEVENELETAGQHLDPESWSDFREFLHRMADDVVDHLTQLDDQPVWQKPTPEAHAALVRDVPSHGVGVAQAYETFNKQILPHVAGNIHPRFWGWVIGSCAPSSLVGDWLATFVNGVPTIFDDSSLLGETQVLEWIKNIFDLGEEASGILTTGASESTLIALIVARYVALGPNLKRHGLGPDMHNARFYISDQTHDASRKAIEILGYGRDHIRVVPSDTHFRMRCDLLEEMIAEDLDAGRKPIAVVATAGTVKTAAFDPMRSIAKTCRRHGVWFHIDGAFGAWSVLSKTKRHLVDGIELADSLALDLHKWMYQAYDLGCVLVRNGPAHREALEVAGSYLQEVDGTLTDTSSNLSGHSIQLSRGFRALKLWFSLTSDGLKSFADSIEGNILLAQYLTRRIGEHPCLELIAPTSLHIVNFRFVEAHRSDEELNGLNKRILRELHGSGFAIPSSVPFGEVFALRVCISNHRTTRYDIDTFVDRVVEIAQEEGAHVD